MSKLSRLIKNLFWSFCRRLFSIDPVSNLKISNTIGMQRIGSRYGGWYVPNTLLNSESVCYCVGAGEDISFDIGLVEIFGCKVWIYDPTPRAKTHFEKLSAPLKMSIDDLDETRSQGTNGCRANVFSKIKFIDEGVWVKKDDVKFYFPQKEEHVSCSIVNLQKTENFFVAKVDRLSAFMKRFGHVKLDLLKIDVEGAEFDIIETIIDDSIEIKILAIEFDGLSHGEKGVGQKRFLKSIQMLRGVGYVLAKVDGANYTFIKATYFHYQ